MATGQGGLASQAAALTREHPNNVTKNPNEKYPQGRPREGQEGAPRTGRLSIAICKCGEVCKNRTGLKRQQTKMGCLRKRVAQAQCQQPVQQLVRRRRIQVWKQLTVSRTSKHHRQTPQRRRSERRQILWPAANKESEWSSPGGDSQG